MNCELPVVQAGFRKGRGTRDQIANIRWIIEKYYMISLPCGIKKKKSPSSYKERSDWWLPDLGALGEDG